jgi:REP element-mobilizing transposase RayT
MPCQVTHAGTRRRYEARTFIPTTIVMSVGTPITSKGIYFITFTCHDWLPLIEATQGYDLVYNMLRVFQSKGHLPTGYVIMPNHLHLLLCYNGDGPSLNKLIGNGKRFMAYELVRRLEQNGDQQILQALQAAVLPKDASRGKKHQVWIESFDAKECRTEKFLLQKLHYIHNNPVSGKWKLAPSSIDYLHSSAPFYLNGRQQLFDVVHYEQLLDWENMYEDWKEVR